MPSTDPPRLTSFETIIVNRFNFCAHGFEVCNLCQCDARMPNDEILRGTFTPETLAMMSPEEMMDKMTKGMMEAANFEKEQRKPLSVAGLIVDTGELEFEDDGGLNYSVWACKTHRRKDCAVCFDWRKLIDAEENKKDGEAQKRERVLALLRSMDVDVPASTKLSLDALEKKLSDALSSAQELPEYPFNPSASRVWKNKAPLLDAFKKGSMAEAYANLRSQVEGRGPMAFSLYENAFVDLRQTVMHIARHHDNGQECCVMEDNNQKEAICIRILGVYTLNDIPVILIIYDTEDGPSMTKTVAFNDAQRKAGAKGFTRIHSTVEEQALFRRLLKLNSTKLSGDFKANLKPHEKSFRASFIVPVAPLSQVQIGKLTNDLGCPVCGKSTTSRCAACRSVSYCGSECQRAHWKTHKADCKRMRGGTWLDATFTENPIIDGKQQYSATINHRSHKASKAKGSLAPPKNVHGDKTFLVKIQRPLVMMGADDFLSMLVYDRNRTFTGHISAKENRKFWTEALKQMPMNSQKLKIYRNAKRSGDWTLSVCLDMEPGEVPQW